MLEDLAREAAAVGLRIHFGKTKILGNMRKRKGVSAAKTLNVDGQEVEALGVGGEV